jgi:hypothetical protein
MNVCPICLYVNSSDASACSRCGKFQFRAGGVTLAEPPSSSTCDAARTKADSNGSVLTKPSGTISMFHMTRQAAEDSPGQVGFGLSSKKDSSTSAGSSATSRLVVKPRLEVVRGEKLGVSFVVLEGRNLIGRTVVTPVDLDLTGQEPAERVWSSRQHACLIFDGKSVILEDLNSLNGTFVNRQRVFPGQQRVLAPNDVIQVGTVQLRLLISADRIDA